MTQLKRPDAFASGNRIECHFRHGSRWRFHFRPTSSGQPLDLSGYSAELVILDHAGAQVARFTGFQFGATGEFSRLELTPDQVSTIPETASSYGIFLTPPAGSEHAQSWFEGPVRVIKKGRYV